MWFSIARDNEIYVGCEYKVLKFPKIFVSLRANND